MMVSQHQYGIGQVNSVLNLPDWASEEFWDSKLEKSDFFFHVQT